MSFNTIPANPYPPSTEQMSAGGGGGSYVLPVASAETLGGVKVGANLSIADGVLSAPAPYVLPNASAETLGGVKVGAGLSIADGVLSLSASGLTFKQLRYEGNGETTKAIDFGNDTPKLIYNIIPDPDETFALNNYEFINGFSWGIPFAFNYWCSQSGGVPTSFGGINVPCITYSGNVATIVGSSAAVACNYDGQKYVVNYLV